MKEYFENTTPEFLTKTRDHCRADKIDIQIKKLEDRCKKDQAKK